MLKKAWAPVRVKERDTQRSRLYKADDVLHPFAQPLPTVRDVERFVKRVWSSKRVQVAYPNAVRRWQSWDLPTVKDGRGRRRAGGWDGGITIPLWARKTDVVIHELAHTIVWRELSSKAAGHGWQFCSVYLYLVKLFMGAEAHAALKASFKQHRIRFTPPRPKKVLSPERRAELVARLATARAQRSTQPQA
jgi:putative metallohydrolase (TIGR04338 family)